MATLLYAIFSFLVFLLVLGVLVIVHEFGHYLAGRLMGFGIDAFSVGFGPKVFEFKGKYNLWQFRWILLGGYVKFRGEVEELAEGEEASSGPGELFYKKKRWQRFLVLIAGVTFNVLLAYVLFAGLSMAGVEESVLRDQPARIGVVAPDSPADKAGLRQGDVITKVDGQAVANWDETRYQIAMLTQKTYDVTVLRNGEKKTFSVTPITTQFLRQPMGEIGVGSSLPPVVGAIRDPSPALKAGLEPGDRILSLNGEGMTYFDQLPAALARSGDKPADFVIEREGARREVTITPEWSEKDKRFMVGISPEESVFVKYPFPACLGKAWRITESMSTLVYRTIKGLVQRKVALSNISGPVSIAYISGEAARAGLNPLLWFVAVISLQLGIFNVLPIPALDGGQLFILMIEGIARRDLPMVVKERILQLGFGLLILLFAFIIIMDTAKFFH